MTSLRWGSATDTGRLRDQNEDALLATDTLFAVADGMGGHAAGEVAAQITIDTLRDRTDGTREGIVDAVKVANRAIIERSHADPDTRGMGTTLSAVALVVDPDSGEDMVLVANVGDSRVYRVHRGELEQLSEDHSLVEDLVRAGRISPAEARHHPNRNIVTRVLGTDTEVEVDSWLVTPETGDRYLLCSDGLSDEVEDHVIARTLLTEKDPASAANRLVEQANDAGGRDNITVIVVDVVDDDGRAAAASAELRKDPPRRSSSATVAREASDMPGPARATDASTTGVVSVVAPAPVKQRRVTWRVVVFVAAVVVVLAGALAFVGWFARNTYYVGTEGEDVVIFRGRPGGVLWIEPTEAEDTDLTLEDIQPSRRDEVEAGHEVSSLAGARRYVENITTTTTSTTTTTTTTSTTVVVPPTPTTAPAP